MFVLKDLQDVSVAVSILCHHSLSACTNSRTGALTLRALKSFTSLHPTSPSGNQKVPPTLYNPSSPPTQQHPITLPSPCYALARGLIFNHHHYYYSIPKAIAGPTARNVKTADETPREENAGDGNYTAPKKTLPGKCCSGQRQQARKQRRKTGRPGTSWDPGQPHWGQNDTGQGLRRGLRTQARKAQPRRKQHKEDQGARSGLIRGQGGNVRGKAQVKMLPRWHFCGHWGAGSSKTTATEGERKGSGATPKGRTRTQKCAPPVAIAGRGLAVENSARKSPRAERQRSA